MGELKDLNIIGYNVRFYDKNDDLHVFSYKKLVNATKYMLGLAIYSEGNIFVSLETINDKDSEGKDYLFRDIK